MNSDPTTNYRLVKDIDARITRQWNVVNGIAQGFTPISTFTGTFDGNGKSISGLYINQGNEEKVGMFSVLSSGGKLLNVNLADAEVTGYRKVGLLAGINEAGVIENCTVSGDVTGNQRAFIVATIDARERVVYDVSVNIGGLVGVNSSTIRNSKANITGTGDNRIGGLVGSNGGAIENGFARGQVNGTFYVGGLAGCNEGCVNDSSALGIIRNSSASVSVFGRVFTGGLVGVNGSTIVKSYATGTVRVVIELANERYTGGLVGLNNGFVLDSYATGMVIGQTFIGGLVGLNNGDISVGYATGGVVGLEPAGGLVGHNNGDISGSYATGKVVGRNKIGGLVGENRGDTSGIVRDSYATGEVSGARKVGGLVGDNSGVVRRSYATGAVSGSSSTGGFAGLIHGGSTIVDSYATGAVSGSGSIGGFAGQIFGFVRHSYATGAVSDSSSTGGFAGKTSNDSTIINSYAGYSQQFVGLDEGGSVTTESGTRTSSQLRCPTTPSETCSDTTTYSGWNSDAWYFGSARVLPLLRSLIDIPVAPTTLSAIWESGNSLELNWKHNGARTYELKIGNALQESSSKTYKLDDSLLLEFRNNYVGGNEISYTVRASETDVVGYPTTGGFSLLDSPSTARINQVSAKASTMMTSLSFPENDGYGRSPGNDDYGVRVNNTELNLRYGVQIFRDGELVAEKEIPLGPLDVDVEFMRLAYPSAYRLVAVAKNAAGEGEEATRNFSTVSEPDALPIISASLESTIKITRGTTNKKITLDASTPPGSAVTWTSSGDVSNGRVYFLATDGTQVNEITGTQVSVVYESAGNEGVVGNGRFDRFGISARNIYGIDAVVFNVVPDDPPVISGAENRTIRIYTRSTESAPLVLTAVDDSVQDLKWTWSPGEGFPVDAATTVRLLTMVEDENSIASVTFSHGKGSISSGTFTVQVRDETGGTDEVQVTVSTTPNRSPTIAGGDEQFLRIIEGKTTASLVLSASDPDPRDTQKLLWSIKKVSLPSNTSLVFTVNGSTQAATTGPTAPLLFIRPDPSSTGMFRVTASDPLEEAGVVDITVLGIPNTTPIITGFGGQEVSDTDTLTIFINPGASEATLRAVAEDQLPNELRWVIASSNSTAASFVTNGGASSTMTSGKPEVIIRLLAEDSSFTLSVFDHQDKSDALTVNVVSTGTKLTIAQGATASRTIPFRVQSTVVELNTVYLWAGLTWNIEASPPGATGEFIGRSDESQVKLNLDIGETNNEALFTITVSNRDDRDSIFVTVVQQEPVDRFQTDCVGQSGFAGGLGSSSSPYQIATLCQLQTIGSTPQAYYQLLNDIEASPTRNWNWVRGDQTRVGFFEGFEPIVFFNGEFYGNGKTITNLYINRPDSENTGLFFFLGSNSLLRQVKILDAEVIGGNNTGLLVGDTGGGIIEGSIVSGSVRGKRFVGGLAGRLSGQIDDSSATVSVVAIDSAGGLAGEAFGNIRRSFASGTVMAERLAGGLVGDGHRIIENSYATVSVSSTGRDAGGLVGHLSRGGSVVYSYATGDIAGDSNVGSLVGDNFGRVGNSYAAESANGSTLIGTNNDQTGQIDANSGLRTLRQIQCPVAAGTTSCEGATTFSGWDSEIWYFGDSLTAPVLRVLSNISSSRSNRSPIIEGSTILKIIQGQTTVSFNFSARDPDSEPGLQWSITKNTPANSNLVFAGGSTELQTTGSTARVQLLFTRRDSISTGSFTLTVKDPTTGVDTLQLTVRESPNKAPVISEFSGIPVNSSEVITLLLSPDIETVTMRAVAEDELPEKLEWTLTPITPDFSATVSFVVGGETAWVSGTSVVAVYFSRDDPAIHYYFGLRVSDHLKTTDMLVIRMRTPEATRSVSIAQGKSLRLAIGSEVQSVEVELSTVEQWAGLIWSIENTTPVSGARAEFIGNASESQKKVAGQVKAKLTLDELPEASFTIKVATSNEVGAPSDTIEIKVIRQDEGEEVGLRLRVLLGGAVR